MPWSVIRRRNGVYPSPRKDGGASCDLEGISEGFRLTKSERAVPGGVEAEGPCHRALRESDLSSTLTSTLTCVLGGLRVVFLQFH